MNEESSVILPLNEEASFRLDFEYPLSETVWYDHLKITLQLPQTEMLLSNSIVSTNLENWLYRAEKALQGDLSLHSSIQENIGKMWNEYLQEKGDHNDRFVHYEGERSWWVGIQNNILDCSKGPTVWLYQSNGQTFLEITPIYPWHFSDPEEREYSFEEFMKGYKTLFITTVERSVLEEWCKTLRYLVDLMEYNFKNNAIPDDETEKKG